MNSALDLTFSRVTSAPVRLVSSQGHERGTLFSLTLLKKIHAFYLLSQKCVDLASSSIVSFSVLSGSRGVSGGGGDDCKN